MSKLKLVLIRGASGSGKSTLAKTEYVSQGYKHYEADMFFYDDKGAYVYNRNLIKESHAWCQNKTEESLQNGENVVVSNTFIKKWELEPYEDLAKLYHADLNILVCKKTYNNIHNVPSDVIRRHIQTFED